MAVHKHILCTAKNGFRKPMCRTCAIVVPTCIDNYVCFVRVGGPRGPSSQARSLVHRPFWHGQQHTPYSHGQKQGLRRGKETLNKDMGVVVVTQYVQLCATQRYLDFSKHKICKATAHSNLWVLLWLLLSSASFVVHGGGSYGAKQPLGVAWHMLKQ